MSMSMALAAHQTPTQILQVVVVFMLLIFWFIPFSQSYIYLTRRVFVQYILLNVQLGGMERVAAYFPVGNTSRSSAFNNHLCLSFVCRMAAGPVYRGKNQCFRVLAFRDVTKKDDSSGAEDPESEPPQISLSSDWQVMKEIKQNSFRTLCRFPGWFSKLQEQKFILRANEILQKPIAQLKLLEGDQIVRELREEEFGHRIMKLWQDSEVWVKWPAVITLTWCFAVTVRYGIGASSDLLPLWLIGPFFMAALIKSSLALYHPCVQITINIVTIGRKILAKFMEAMHNRVLALQTLQARWVERIVYIQSGKFITVWRERFNEYKVQKTDEFYDYMDYWWIKWRQVKRFLKKIL